MDRIETSDSYHASYLLANGQTVEGVTCIPVGSGVSCTLVFSGPQVLELTDAFFCKTACVNLYAFRHAYNQVQTYIQQGLRRHRAEQKRARVMPARQAGGER